MARIISTCGGCKTKTIREYLEASRYPAQFWRGERLQTTIWLRADTGERVCLAYEQDGCGMCSWHPQGCNGRCPNCDGVMRHQFKRGHVHADHNPHVKCGARCHMATSDTCSCECDGANHGRAYRLPAPVRAEGVTT